MKTKKKIVISLYEESFESYKRLKELGINMQEVVRNTLNKVNKDLSFLNELGDA